MRRTPRFNASAALAHELKSLNLVFSVPDLIKIMGPNSARVINKEKDLRTIEVRKLGDLVILVGNPFEGYWNLLTAVVVVRNGEIMADKRGQPNAGKPIVHGYSSSSLGLRFESGELRPRFVDREVQERDSDQFARFTLEVDPAEPRPASRGRQVAR
jgi:hypothetical protein